MKRHIKKVVAPVITVFCVALYFIFVGQDLLLSYDLSLPAKILSLVTFCGLMIACILAFAERIKEIEDGEEDDLSKY